MAEQLEVHASKIERLEKDTEEQWSHINKIEEMLHKLVPVWVALILMAMSGITGAALTFAGMIIKFK